MFIKITCPKCNTDCSFSISGSSYDGPYRCWKCKETFNLNIKNSVVQSCQTITQDQFNQAVGDKKLNY